ncbi:MAG: fumarate hydratase [Candidatus Marinimicrobia bacterium]|nr:fumarate hydratase [Candidatus Neomarinimicrobiota bacterium]
MRKIQVNEITKIIKKLSMEASIIANDQLIKKIEESVKIEESSVGKAVLKQLLRNIEISKTDKTPICQDTGFTVVFMDIGQDVSFVGGSLEDAVNKGVGEGYVEAYLRKSIILDPISNPRNSNNNTPAILHTHIVEGDKVKITVLPKGGGAENMSRIKMLKPADGIEGIKNFVIETVKNAGGNPCPPTVIGVGIGGTFDYVAYLAKKAIMRDFGDRNKDKQVAKYEVEWLEEINKLGIGPAGLGGKVTSLDLFIEVYPRHIATYPVAVNIQCNANRKKSIVL